MIIAFVIVCWCLTITFFCWLYYCIHHSFEIILQGLRRAYWVWLSHLVLLIVITVCWNVRPSWELHPQDFLYDNEWVCKIWGKVHAILYASSHFLVTIFSAYKAEIYFKIIWNRKWFVQAFKVLIWIGIIPVIALIIVYPVGPQRIDGYNVCMKLNTVAQSLWQVILIHWFCMNAVMNFIFWFYSNIPANVFPSLEHQTMINRRLIPIMFLSSLIILIAASVAKYFTRNSWLPFALQTMHLLDIFLNNVVMYYTLFGHVGFLQREADIRRRLEYTADMNSTREEDVTAVCNVEVKNSLEGYVYISLPGMHPIRVSLELVEEHELHEYIITKRKILRQIKKYRKRGIIPSLCRSCNTSEELLEQIEAMEQAENRNPPSPKPPPVTSNLRLSHLKNTPNFLDEQRIPTRRSRLVE